MFWSVVNLSVTMQFAYSLWLTNDFEDAMQYYTAVKAKADVIITRNGKDFAASKLPVMTAAEYLATITG